jgi:hypothetical protein
MDFKSPLSGDVTELFKINPFFKTMTEAAQQIGFINVYNVGSSDPEAEMGIVKNVAGYGKQLGWILEALALLVSKLYDSKVLDISKLKEDEVATFSKIRSLLQDIEKEKTNIKS